MFIRSLSYLTYKDQLSLTNQCDALYYGERAASK